MIISFNAVRCHTLCVKISQIMYVNVVQSFALTKKNEFKVYRAAEEILLLERFPHLERKNVNI